MEKNKHGYIIETNFENWVKNEEPFAQWLRSGMMHWWNFNCCIWGKPGDPVYLAIHVDNLNDPFLTKNYEIVQIVEDIALLKKETSAIGGEK